MQRRVEGGGRVEDVILVKWAQSNTNWWQCRPKPRDSLQTESRQRREKLAKREARSSNIRIDTCVFERTIYSASNEKPPSPPSAVCSSPPSHDAQTTAVQSLLLSTIITTTPTRPLAGPWRRPVMRNRQIKTRLPSILHHQKKIPKTFIFIYFCLRTQFILSLRNKSTLSSHFGKRRQ